MEPLDLTTRPPRATRDELDGIMFLPRAIDKVRSSLPGGKSGTYLSLMGSVPTLSSLFYRCMGITHEAFTDAVAAAPDEAAIVAWLRPQIPQGGVEKLKSRLLGTTLGDLGQARAAVNALYPAAATTSDQTLLIDLIDADDAALFAGTKP